MSSLLIVGALGAVVSGTIPDRVVIREQPDHVTEAIVIVEASPDQVYDLVTNYESWRTTFSDIESVRLKGGDRHNAKVEFRSRTFGQTVTVAFKNEPGRAIRFRGIKGPPGGKAHGEYLLTPLDGGARTQITARLFMDVSLPASLFVSGTKVRAMRQRKLRADLTDMARRFSRPQVQASH